MEKKKCWVGIDVSKEVLEISVQPSQENWKAKTTKGALKKLAKRLKSLNPSGVIVEATGGWERPVLNILKKDVPMIVMNPRRIRDFAKAAGKLAKTDRIDATIIALFGEKMEPEIRPLPTPEEERKRALLDRHRQLKEMLTQEKNRLGISQGDLKRDVKRHIDWLEKQLKDLNDRIQKEMESDPDWAQKDACLQAVKGVGSTLSLAMLGAVPELGTLNRRRIAALVGVAPFNSDSGKRRGERHIFGGRRHVRNVLYMATLAATRSNPIIRDHYQHLRKKGKKSKVAIVACMRKLLLHLNTLMRQHLALRMPVMAAS